MTLFNSILSQRVMRANIGNISSIMMKAASIIVTFISLPMILNNIGGYQFGVYATLLSVITIFGLLDFGVSNGSVVRISQVFHSQDLNKVGKMVTALFLLTFAQFTFVLVLGGFFYSGLVNFNGLALEDNSSQNWNHLIGLCLAFVSITIVINLPQKILLAINESNKSSFVNLSSVITASIGALIGSFLQNPIEKMILIALTMQMALGLVAYIHLLLQLKKKNIVNSIPSRLMLISTLAGGKSYILLQGLAIIGSQLPTLLIFNLLSPIEVSLYFTTFKLVSLPVGFTVFFFQSLWPLIAGKMAVHNFEEANDLYTSKLRVALLIAGLSLIWNISLGGHLVSTWTSGKVQPSFALVFLLSVNVSLVILLQPILFTLNGLEEYGRIIMWTLTYLVVSTFATYILCPLLGVVGTTLSTVIFLTILQLLPFYFYIKKEFREKLIIKTTSNKNVPAHDV